MEDEIARLRRQLEQERSQCEEAERRREEAERSLEPNNLFGLLEGCHGLLSQTIQVETNAR